MLDVQFLCILCACVHGLCFNFRDPGKDVDEDDDAGLTRMSSLGVFGGSPQESMLSSNYGSMSDKLRKHSDLEVPSCTIVPHCIGNNVPCLVGHVFCVCTVERIREIIQQWTI